MQTTRKITTLAMICAIAFLLAAFVRFPVVLFLRYDPKDVVITIGGFLFGPVAALIVTVVVALLQMVTVSATGPIGAIMNIVSGAAFCCTAAFIYSKKRTLKGAVLGLIVATIFATGVMVLWNYLVTPVFMGIPRQDVVDLLIPAFIPFNLISGILNSALVMLLYKPVRTALKASNLMPHNNEPAQKGKISAGIIITSLFIIATCVLWILVLQGVF